MVEVLFGRKMKLGERFRFRIIEVRLVVEVFLVWIRLSIVIIDERKSMVMGFDGGRVKGNSLMG